MTGCLSLPEGSPAMHNGEDQPGDCPMSERSLGEAALRQSRGDDSDSRKHPAPGSRQTNQGEVT